MEKEGEGGNVESFGGRERGGGSGAGQGPLPEVEGMCYLGRRKRKDVRDMRSVCDVPNDG